MSSAHESDSKGQQLRHATDLISLSGKPDKDQSQPQQNDVSGGNGLAALNLPKGGGAIRSIGEKFTVSAATGTATASIPLPTSAARGGFNPALTLSYDSGAGNGPFGFGWHLSMPSVIRKTELGLPQYRDAVDSDIYTISGDDDLVPVLTRNSHGKWQRKSIVSKCINGDDFEIALYRPRVESSFSRIERWMHVKTGKSHWRSISRSNTTTIYGEDDSSRIFDPQYPTHIFQWLASRSFDDKGNAILFEYKKENADGIDTCIPHEAYRASDARTTVRYPKRIKYGNRVSHLLQDFHSSSDWMFEVVFDYGEHDELCPSTHEVRKWALRPDPFSSYKAGFEERTYRLCQRVLMFHHFPDEPDVGADTVVTALDVRYRYQDYVPETSLSTASCVESFRKTSYLRTGSTYSQSSLPPIEFEYSKAAVSDKIQYLDHSALENLPIGLNEESGYQWLDLDGEGVSGILAHQGEAFFFKPNLGDGRFGPADILPQIPSVFAGKAPAPRWMDLKGDGHVEMIRFDGSMPGYYKRTSTSEIRWEPFRTFPSLPQIQWNDPNLKYIDLTGDGHVDLLLVHDDIFTWYEGWQDQGFGPPHYWRPPIEENQGPRLLMADGVETIYTADMTGDGLSDLLRVRNSEICYWPNLGYGRFGTKITMSNAPCLDYINLFRQNRIHLSDIDGSGTTDLLYVGGAGVKFYLNQAGNGWTNAYHVAACPATPDTTAVSVVDLLGKGTSCLVWSSPNLSDCGRQVQYLDLMADGKPYLLTRATNNLGAETRYHYASSTHFYLKDKAAGNIWSSKLPFAVQVVEKMENLDLVGKNQFLTRYAYHEGCYDAVEREFRGFGMVETWDTEEYSTLMDRNSEPKAANINVQSNVPPSLTKTWFHTGVDLRKGGLLATYRDDFYTEPHLTRKEIQSLWLPDSQRPRYIRHGAEYLPYSLDPGEVRESYRALKGVLMRQELYALDKTDAEALPYQVNQSNFTVELFQPRSCNSHACFFMHPRESVQFSYERKLYDVGGELVADPRVSHNFVLKTDDFGNVLQTFSINYGRRYNGQNRLLQPEDHDLQLEDHAILTDNAMTNLVSTDDDWMTPLAAETRAYQVFKARRRRPDGKNATLLTWDQVQQIIQTVQDGNFDVPFEDFEGKTKKGNHPYRRLLQHSRTIYRKNDLSGPLPLGELQSFAIPHFLLQRAFDSQQIEQILVADNKLASDEIENVFGETGAYVRQDDNPDWWIPSAKLFFTTSRSDSSETELAYAKEHFFLPRRSESPFSSEAVPIESTTSYDKYDLLIQETCDPLGNRNTAGERNIDPNLPLVHHGQDYRLLQPFIMMDANRNRIMVAFDIMGMVVGSATMGKPEDRQGDSLLGFVANLSKETVRKHFEHPLNNLPELLGNATARMVYDYCAFYRTRDEGQPLPNWSSTLSRETHVSDLAEGQKTRIFVNFGYSDGLARVIQQKVQTEPGPIPDFSTTEITTKSTTEVIENRWLGSGWTIFNNKGKPVRQFEPFFCATHQFQNNNTVGVSPTIFYDPLQRGVACLLPDHTWTKTIFDPWHSETWDGSDTILLDPEMDNDVGDFFRRLPAERYQPSWYAQRIDGSAGPEAKQAAKQTEVHANTPRTMFSDSMGRTFVGIETIKTKRSNESHASEEIFRNRAILDIQGSQHRLYDSKGRLVSKASYNYVGALIKQQNMENGQRWSLVDVSGKSLLTWDSREHRLRTVYDTLRRPADVYLRVGNRQESLVERSVYGESQPEPEASNSRARIIRVDDQAGITFTALYDFKGNTLGSKHQLAAEYRRTIDWSHSVEMQDEVFEQSLTYDAFNRMVTSTLPDGTVNKVLYNARGQEETVTASFRGSQQWKPVIKDAEYDSKGQRTYAAFDNRTESKFTYDPLTFRLTRIVTLRQRTDKEGHAGLEGSGKSLAKGPKHCPAVQSLHYTYDATGNITSAIDEAQDMVFFRNHCVDPSQQFTYDSTYRLVEAFGREHLGQTDEDRHRPSPGQKNVWVRMDHPHDGGAMGRYVERYYYDGASNFLRMQHCNLTSSREWTRHYDYDEPSLLEEGRNNNRLSRTRIGKVTQHYQYEGLQGAHGNLTAMPGIPQLRWNYRDQLCLTSSEADGEKHVEATTTWYRYDATGKRVRKVTERQVTTDSDEGEEKQHIRLKETIYIGASYDVFRKYRSDGEVKLEIQAVNITDGNNRALRVETKTIGDDCSKIPAELFRYQYGNHQRSVTLELDDTGQTISYEEYTPYGNTAYQASDGQTKIPKRYRYVGQEKDDSGLYYQGARYYASWLGRWVSTDPQGMIDGLNLYIYTHCNPVGMVDPGGTAASTPTEFHNEMVGKFKTILEHLGHEVDTEVTITKRVGDEIGSRVDLLLAKASIDIKTTSVDRFLNKEGKLTRVGDLAADFRKALRETFRHIRAIRSQVKEVVGLESAANEALVYIGRGSKKGEQGFTAFSKYVETFFGQIGRPAAAVFHESDIEGAVAAIKAGGAAAAENATIKEVGKLLQRNESNVLKAAEIAKGVVNKVSAGLQAIKGDEKGAVAIEHLLAAPVAGGLALASGAANVLAKAAPVLKVAGKAAVLVSTFQDVQTLAGNGPTSAKVDAGADLAANLLMESGVPPLEIAGAALAAGGAVGGAVAPKVEAFAAAHGASQDTAGLIGRESGVLAGAATGAAVGAVLGSVVPGLGTAVGAAIGAGVGAIGAAIKIRWGS